MTRSGTAQMVMVPGRIAELRAEEEAARRAAMPKAGERARLTHGPFAGFIVDISRIDGGLARFVMTGGLKGEAQAETLERVA